MLILFETPAGYALFRCLNEKKLKDVDSIYKYFEDEDKAKKMVELIDFSKFKNTADALKSASKLVKSKLPSKLEKMLTKNLVDEEIQDKLAIADKKIGKVITEKLGIECKSGDAIREVMRGIKSQMTNLISGISEDELKSMTLGLAHGLSRYTLKFTVDKVDTMIVQAISLLDNLEKETNNYMMRLREWYGWHFPELSKVITDNLLYAKTVNLIGMREKTKDCDLSTVLPDDIAKEVKEAAEISMGTEINVTDEKFILMLAEQIIELSEYRHTLTEYLKNRMAAIAPNLTQMVGEIVGARLISHAGNLINLAKYPASTVQILGAEKALFKAIRTKHNTPKYGLIYQASLVGKAPASMKGKISRALAAKCSLCSRVDALGEDDDGQIGLDSREYIEKRMTFLENASENAGKGGKPQKPKFVNKQENSSYNMESDFTGGSLQKTFVSQKRKASSDSNGKSIKKVKQ